MMKPDDRPVRSSMHLERKHLLEDTMLIFTSDHGYFYGEHGLGRAQASL
jgi:arylsulfatase A-like enzyme